MSQASGTQRTPESAVTDAGRLRRAGLVFGLSAYIWWGFSPLYFHLLRDVPPFVTFGHRVVWSVALLVVLITATRKWAEVRAVIANRRIWGWLLCSTLLIAINWIVYIYAVSINHVLDSSLGFFINPLVTVLLGLVFLGERMDRSQWIASGIAAAGIAFLTYERGGLPWITIVLSLAFALYGLVRKVAPVSPMTGVFVETALLAPVSAVYLVWMHTRPDASFNTPYLLLMLSLAGVVTTLPMLWFIAAARRLPLVALGFLQFINPTLQFLVAVVLLGEPFEHARAIAFGLVWVAMAIFVVDMVRKARTRGGEPTTSNLIGGGAGISVVAGDSFRRTDQPEAPTPGNTPPEASKARRTIASP